MSQLSWVMQLFYAMHIGAMNAISVAKKEKAGKVIGDIQAFPFRGILPSATSSDHEALRSTLVVPYMLRPPEKFNQRDLVAVLRGNPITGALLELCPDKYERY